VKTLEAGAVSCNGGGRPIAGILNGFRQQGALDRPSPDTKLEDKNYVYLPS